jgi:hypothetical protein
MLKGGQARTVPQSPRSFRGPVRYVLALFLPLFTRVRGREILGTSP